MRRICTLNNLTALVAIVAALCFTTACQSDMQEVAVGKGGVKVGFYASGQDASTKTEMLPDGLSATWTSGDRVAVWAKNSASSYILANQSFSLYGSDRGKAFFTSTLPAAMPEDDYVYYAVYPCPVSQNATSVTFELPSVQDGKVSGGTDIMIATPMECGALKALSDPEDHSAISLEMNHILHHLRFWMPLGENALGEDIEEIVVSMPDGVCGKLTADFTDPSAVLSLSDASNEISLNLASPLGETDFESANFACAAVFPHETPYGPADSMRLTVYTKSSRSVLKAIPLEGRAFLAGHSTPVRLLPVDGSQEEYYRVSLKVGDNHIGEPLTDIYITAGGSELFRETGPLSNTVIERNYLGVQGRADYDALVNAVSAGAAELHFETEHALVDIPLDASSISIDGNQAVVGLGDVPYLLDEDFSNAKAVAHDDDYSAGASQDRNKGGYLLDDYMPRKGWNASRFSLREGDCVRINSRYQSGAWIVERNNGRLDTPAMSYLKPGVSVRVRIEYSEAFYVPAGYNVNDSNVNRAQYFIGKHTRPESSSIEGIRTSTTSAFSPESGTEIIFTSDTFPSEDISALHRRSLDADAAGNTTRFVFFVFNTQTMKHVGANACYYLYLDNIRIYIDN